MEMKKACKSCHWGAALVAGLSAGLAAGLFAHSKKGEELTAEAKKAGHHMQKELMKLWKQTEHFSKKEYDESVKEIVGHYQRAKGLAVDQVADLQEFLLDQWDTLQKKILK